MQLTWGSSTSTDTESYVVLCSKLTSSFPDPWGVYGSDVTQMRVPVSQTSLLQTMPGPGPWYYGVYAMDLAGNRSPVAQFSSTDQAPTATWTAPPSGWVSGGATLTVQASEDGSSDGVTAYWAADDGTPSPYLAPFKVSQEGTTTVACWAVDAQGNRSATQTVEVRVDNTPPTTSDDHAPVYAGSASIHLVASDRLSGVAATNWTLDGVQGTGLLITTKTIGVHALTYSSVDVAGNHERTRSLTFRVSRTTSTRVGLSGAPSTRVSKSYALTGSVTPKVGGSVRLVLSRLVGTTWVGAGSATVAVRAGKFTYKFKPPRKGRWRVAASYLGQSTPSVTYLPSSATKMVNVK